MDKCPFCGAASDKNTLVMEMSIHPLPEAIWFQCGTVIENHLQIWKTGRGSLCYETEITNLKKLVGEIGSRLNQLYEGLVITEGLRCPYCLNRPKLSGKAFHKEWCPILWIDKILSHPEVKAIMEEKS